MRIVLWLVIAGSLITILLGGMYGPWVAGLDTAATVLLIIASLALPAGSWRRKGRKFRDAPIGIGTVVSARRTGLTVNDRPQLEILFDVDTPDGQTFRGVARQLVDVTELAMVEPGATMAVRYRPGGRDDTVVVATDASQAEVQSAFNLVQLAKGHLDAQGLRIAEHGVDAKAVVLEMRPTGEIRDDRSVLDLTLRVTRPDGTGFEVAAEKAVPPALVSRVQPGSVVMVKYLPGDERTVALALPMQQ
ncbi:hypothetical protein [Actinophytocola sp. NPDC049390]|uniref:hypothetical protein n=1 Tax=Actinophytocola sp. NPDC049390 TaxID=3363894 RepID=UPI00379E261A